MNQVITKPTGYELRIMIDEGMTLYQISRKYNTTIPVIFQLEKYYGLIPKTFILKKCYRISKEDLKSMYIDEHMRQWQIAEELGCSQVHVHNMMDYYNIPTRGRGKFTPQQRASISDEIVQRYNNGETQEEIAKKVGYSQIHVSKILQQRDIPTRQCGKFTSKQRSSIYDEIVRLHNDEHMTQEEIAKKVGYSLSNVWTILHERDVQTRLGGKYTAKQRSSKADDIVQRHNNGDTRDQIAEKVGYSIAHVGQILRERGVQTRGSGKYTPQQRALIYDKIEQEYKGGKTTYQIAEEFGYDRSNVSKILQQRDVPTRVPNGTITRQEMSLITADKIQYCIDKGMNQHQIAEHFDVSEWKIFDLCEKFNIPGMVDNFRCTTPEYIDWRDEVLLRDNYTCQLCGSPERPEVHHIYPFRYYPERRYDVDNGIVLCHNCHRKVTGHESEYIVELEDIVLRDRGIGDDIEPGIDYIDYLARKFDQKGVEIFGGELPVHEYTSIPKEE